MLFDLHAGSQKQVGVLPVNVPQRGGGLLIFVIMSSQISTLSRGWRFGISKAVIS